MKGKAELLEQTMCYLSMLAWGIVLYSCQHIQLIKRGCHPSLPKERLPDAPINLTPFPGTDGIIYLPAIYTGKTEGTYTFAHAEKAIFVYAKMCHMQLC